MRQRGLRFRAACLCCTAKPDLGANPGWLFRPPIRRTMTGQTDLIDRAQRPGLGTPIS